MTEPSIYLLQSEANEESAKIAQKDFPEWAIIMYFYAALHLINDGSSVPVMPNMSLFTPQPI
ncbi:hypothetical protein [Anabaena sp. AL93]|jgi:hypothetical protein|uniref:hypothetical protein n=1 Tax=Anabaena sp. AL93 TaxID=1678133 RepID=UPI0007FF45D3|nr:hypothetical protein [Anabaena sp. AL93]OBQ23059.1 MAG: hypothetical protein AN486_01005 [Anabaena sp. AL93]